MSAEELKQANMYFNRPASELIFLTNSEHWKLHMSGFRNPNYGKEMPIERKIKLSINNGSHRQEVRDKISKTRKERKCGIGNKNAVGSKGHSGLKWITNGITEKTIPIGETPPDGFRFGRKLWKKKS